MLEKTFAQTQLLKKGLDGFWLKNQVLADNIANANTPGYKAKDVNVQSFFQQNLLGVENMSVSSVSKVNDKEYTITEKTGLAVKADGNNVDIEEEMTELAKNQIMYEALIQKVTRNIQRMKYAIDEGGK